MARKRSRGKSSGGGGWIVNTVLGVMVALVLAFAGSAIVRNLPPLGRESEASPGRTARSASAQGDHSHIRVEVWNGSGMAGGGQRVAEALRDGGFAVGEVRNADRSDYGTTLVVDRKGNRAAVDEVIQYLHGGFPLLMKSATAAADVRVVVGRDQEGLRLTP
jgi:hypothetical protein